MANNNTIGSEVLRMLLSFLVTIPMLMENSSFVVNGKPRVPCFFIFGDSLADNGNSNFLLHSIQANFSPYGIDYPTGVTGRFTNNQTYVDILAELLGLERSIPPFEIAIFSGNITSGVNYAYSSAGILDDIGNINVSFDRQLINHQITISQLKKLLGNNETATANYLNKCLYSVGFGTRDYIKNFLPTTFDSTLTRFSDTLIKRYETQLRNLHKLGARKVMVNAIGPIGCTPYAITRFGDNMSNCVDRFDMAVRYFNDNLFDLSLQLSRELADTKFMFPFIYYVIFFDLITRNHGNFKVTDKACCSTQMEGRCMIDGIPCQNRNEYLYYDDIHPTDAANRFAAMETFNQIEKYLT